MTFHAPRGGRKALALAAFTSASLLAVSTGSAFASYSAKIQNGTLQLTGNGASDTLVLGIDGPTRLFADVGGDGTIDFSFDRSTFTAINVQAGGGDDLVQLQSNAGILNDETITIDGGAGDDTLLGGDSNETLNGGGGDDTIDGNRGADTEFGGGGNDTFVWDPGDGSDVLEGQSGKDTLVFNGSNANEQTSLTANGSRVRLARDVAAITQDMDGIETTDLNMIGGADTATVGDLSGTDLATANVNLAASGGGGDAAADTVIVDGTAGPDTIKPASQGGVVSVSGLAATVHVSGGEPANDRVDVDTLGGADSVIAGPGDAGPAVAVDGGDDADTLTFNGTTGDDTIGIARDGASAAIFTPGGETVEDSAVENTVVRGRKGNDTVVGQNGISTLTHLEIDGNAGNDTLDGGDGDDTLNGGGGDDTIDGNRGADTEFGGGGNDTFVWDPGDASDVLEGQSGKDTLVFNGSNASENIDLSANGSRVRLFRNVAAVTQDFDGIEAADVNTLGAADILTVNDLTGTDVKNVVANLAATGGGGDAAADAVIVNGTNERDRVNVTREGDTVVTSGLAATTTIAGSEPANDTLNVNTIGGDDTVTVAPDVSDLIAPIVDLGADQ